MITFILIAIALLIIRMVIQCIDNDIFKHTILGLGIIVALLGVVSCLYTKNEINELQSTAVVIVENGEEKKLDNLYIDEYGNYYTMNIDIAKYFYVPFYKPEYQKTEISFAESTEDNS